MVADTCSCAADHRSFVMNRLKRASPSPLYLSLGEEIGHTGGSGHVQRWLESGTASEMDTSPLNLVNQLWVGVTVREALFQAAKVFAEGPVHAMLDTSGNALADFGNSTTAEHWKSLFVRANACALSFWHAGVVASETPLGKRVDWTRSAAWRMKRRGEPRSHQEMMTVLAESRD